MWTLGPKVSPSFLCPSLYFFSSVFVFLYITIYTTILVGRVIISSEQCPFAAICCVWSRRGPVVLKPGRRKRFVHTDVTIQPACVNWMIFILIKHLKITCTFSFGTQTYMIFFLGLIKLIWLQTFCKLAAFKVCFFFSLCCGEKKLNWFISSLVHSHRHKMADSFLYQIQLQINVLIVMGQNQTAYTHSDLLDARVCACACARVWGGQCDSL